MGWLIWGIALFFAVKCVLHIVRIHQSKSFLDTRRPTHTSPASRSVALLIPVYDEAKIIERTVVRFNNLSNQYDIDVYFVTAELEGNGKANVTEALIAKFANSRTRIIHCPHASGAKAAQVNYAMDIIANTKPVTYYGVFDADSSPDGAGIEYVKQDTDNPTVYQMPSIYGTDFSDLPLLAKAGALFQTRWTLCYEIPQWRRWQDNPGNPPLMYIVGHGIFFNAGKRLRFNESTIAEDLELGYRLSSDRQSLKVVPYVDRCAVAKSLKINIVQSARWFYGEITLYKTFMAMFSTRQNRTIYTLRFLKRYSQILEWLLAPAIVVGLSIYALIGAHYWIAGFYIFLCTIYIFGVHEETRRIIGAQKRVYLFIAYRVLVNCLGPVYGLSRIAIDKIGIRQFTFVKTER